MPRSSIFTFVPSSPSAFLSPCPCATAASLLSCAANRRCTTTGARSGTATGPGRAGSATSTSSRCALSASYREYSLDLTHCPEAAGRAGNIGHLRPTDAIISAGAAGGGSPDGEDGRREQAAEEEARDLEARGKKCHLVLPVCSFCCCVVRSLARCWGFWTDLLSHRGGAG